MVVTLNVIIVAFYFILYNKLHPSKLSNSIGHATRDFLDMRDKIVSFLL